MVSPRRWPLEGSLYLFSAMGCPGTKTGASPLRDDDAGVEEVKRPPKVLCGAMIDWRAVAAVPLSPRPLPPLNPETWPSPERGGRPDSLAFGSVDGAVVEPRSVPPP